MIIYAYDCFIFSAERDWAVVCHYIDKLNRSQIKRIGGELGLDVFNLEKMQNLCRDMVIAWLRKEDQVKEKCGDPLTWEHLVEALRNIGQNLIADDIFFEQVWAKWIRYVYCI